MIKRIIKGTFLRRGAPFAVRRVLPGLMAIAWLAWCTPSFAQGDQKSSKRASAKSEEEGEIVMTVEELESLLKTVAERRKKVLDEQRQQLFGRTAVSGSLQLTDVRSREGLMEQELRLLQQKVDLLLTHAQLNAAAYPVTNPAGTTVQVNQTPTGGAALQPANPAVGDVKEDATGTTQVAPDAETAPGGMLVTPGRQLLVGRTVYFAHNSTRLSAADRDLIAQLVPTIKEHEQSILVVLRGYASKVGKAFYNNQLSFERAEVIKQQLLEHGVSPASIMIFYHGADPTLAAAEARRVDITLEILPMAKP